MFGDRNQCFGQGIEQSLIESQFEFKVLFSQAERLQICVFFQLDISILYKHAIKYERTNYKCLKLRIQYYSNSVATFQLLIACGDVQTNPGRLTTELSSANKQNNRHNNNLINIVCSHGQRPDGFYGDPVLFKPLRFCLWNCQSVRNKTAALQDYLCEKKIDLCALTETWLLSDDDTVRAECIPSEYKIFDQIRSRRGGGGIALLSCAKLSVSIITTGERTSFEFVEYMVSHENNSIKVVVVYRTPYSGSHQVTVTTFLNEFAEYLESIVLSPEPLLVTGDMNIHVDDTNDTDAVKFLDLLESMGMTQHVNTPTHRAGHTLDLMITREFDCMIHSEPSSLIFYSDHCMVLAELSLHKPALTVKKVSCRKIKDINKTCRSAFYHLHNIRRIRKYLSRESTEKLVHAFVTSHLDYCNGLLYGLPNNAFRAAARILYRAPRFAILLHCCMSYTGCQSNIELNIR